LDTQFECSHRPGTVRPKARGGNESKQPGWGVPRGVVWEKIGSAWSLPRDSVYAIHCHAQAPITFAACA